LSAKDFESLLACNKPEQETPAMHLTLSDNGWYVSLNMPDEISEPSKQKY